MKQLIEEIKTSLAEDRFSDNRRKWAQFIVDNNIPMMDLIELLDAEHPIGMRFTWVFGDILEQKPMHIFPIVATCFARRNEITFPGFDRTVAKMLSVAGIPEEIEGIVVDELFKWVLSPKRKVAVKVFAIDALGSMVLKYPALKEELLLVIDDQLDKNTVAFSARAKKVKKRLKKLV